MARSRGTGTTCGGIRGRHRARSRIAEIFQLLRLQRATGMFIISGRPRGFADAVPSSIVFGRALFLGYRWRWADISSELTVSLDASGITREAIDGARLVFQVRRRARGIHGGMGNHWRSRKAFGRYANNMMRHRLAAAEALAGTAVAAMVRYL